MTDDFHLFGDPDDGDRRIDPDIALVSAYLARELSPMQVLALEERLVTDRAFRAAMQPLLDAWATPLPSLEAGEVGEAHTLSDLERERSWRRYVAESQPARPLTVVPPRRSSMKRAAAVAALIVVPMASFAQVVVHAAGNPNARGHAFAKRIVAPFTGAIRIQRSEGERRRTTQLPPGTSGAREVDTGALLPVPTAPVFELESDEAAAKRQASMLAGAVTPVTRGATLGAQAQRHEPDRARIADLARLYQPDVIAGDTTASYIVMIVDAANNYLWSTPGSGNLTIEVFGDTRTPAERSEYNRMHHAEFWGNEPAAVAGGYAIGVDDSVRSAVVATGTGIGARSASGRAGTAVARRDSAPMRGAATGAVSGRTLPARDSVAGSGVGYTVDSGSPRIVYTSPRRAGASLTADSARIFGSSTYEMVIGAATGAVAGMSASGGGRVSRASATAARGSGLGGNGAEGASPIFAFDRDSGTYRAGWYGTPNRSVPNQAAGLTAPGNGESGIEGLASTSVASAETYYFPAGELAPGPLKIMVVHLAPGTVWSPR